MIIYVDQTSRKEFNHKFMIRDEIVYIGIAQTMTKEYGVAENKNLIIKIPKVGGNMYINRDINYLKYLKDKDVVIFGAGERGKWGLSRLKTCIGGVKVTAFCDNDTKKQGGSICGVNIISLQKLKEINHDDLMIIICSAYEREIKQQLLDGKLFNFISISQIDFGGGEEHYDEQYFSYQQVIGKFGGKIAADIFKPYIKEDMKVVEFGSGGGYLLQNLCAREKIGIEINDAARKAAKEAGIDSVKHISDIPDHYADIIISTHVLEHVENPLGALRELRTKLRDGGKAVFHVPNESCHTEYQRSEINNHLYTWNCLNIGNLFKAAGYFVYSVETIQEVWPRRFLEIGKQASPELFEAICEIGGKASDENRCLIVAYK